MSGFLGVPVGAAYHLVFALTHLLTPVAGGLAAAAAIVLFTAAVRLLICPLSLRALRGQAAMARLAPQVQALRTRYGRQPERFKRELTALYKREGTSPFAGILPLLAQWPFLSVMYLLFRSATVDGAQNQLLSDGLFGVPLGAHWLSGRRPAQRPRRALPRRLRGPRRPVLAVGPPGEAGSPRRRGDGRSARRQQGGGPAYPGAPVRDRGHRRVRPPGRRHLPAHHRRLDPRRTPPLPAPHRAGRRCPGA